MPKRYFMNKFPDFHASGVGDVLATLNKTKMHEKASEISSLCVSKFTKHNDNCDGGLYVGLGGLSYALWYMSTKRPFETERGNLLKQAKTLLEFHLNFADKPKRHDDRAAFLLGSGGLYSTAVLLYHSLGDNEKVQMYSKKYAESANIIMPIDYFSHGGDEMLVGRAGYLCGLLNLRLKFPEHEIVSDKTVEQIIKVIYESGKKYSHRHKSPCPLMYAYYDTEYLGAAHGLSGILQMMLSFPEILRNCHDIEKAVKASVDWMLSIQQPDGNTPSSSDEVGVRQGGRPDEDELIHWCHGAPGNVYMYVRAYLYWREEKYLQAGIKCGEVVWEKGLLKKGPGTCHGVSGNAYVFLTLYRLTKDQKHLYRALRFVDFMDTDEFKRGARTPDTPYSLFEGLAGAVCLYADLADDPNHAEFPLYPVFF